MNMTNLMNELVREAQAIDPRSAGAVRQTEKGEVRVMIQPANCINSGRNEQIRKTWYLDGKRIAAKKLEAL